MSQPSVASFFSSRKRVAGDEILLGKNKRLADDGALAVSTTRSGRLIKRIGSTDMDVPAAAKTSKIEEPPVKLKQQKLVKFIKRGNLSPNKKMIPQTVSSDFVAFAKKESATNVERGLSTPTKQIISSKLEKDQLNSMVRKELNFDEVKTKVTRSAKLQELKASLGRLQELEKVRKQQEERNSRLRSGESPVKKSTVTLKEFKTIELEVLTSPKKGLKTPTKIPPPAPDKHGLMSPKNSTTPKKLLFSPTKDGSPAKLVTPPAYQRFLNLVEAGKPSLQLPYKYRCLVEMFKAVDSVCAMLFNRKEIITFKKLKPAVQRMLRRNFNESHLAQIRHLYPEAYNFTQMKMRNFGSTSKQDYFQLVITPNVDGVQGLHIAKIDEDNVLKAAQSNALNPQIMTERQRKFTNILLTKVKEEHDKFLRSLDPPLIISSEKITRWHPEFDLENCPEIEQGHLPQPPNVEKYSSAKDILSTARNLFNCSTPLERAMERLDAKTEEEKKNLINPTNLETEKKPDDPVTSMLKGIPQSLLDKIRAKQAAKALDAMTRRPSQDREATKYSRLPELARHLRNVFITEKKSVLPLEIVIKKIENSYRTCLTAKEIETHMQLIAKECPKWIAFHEIRKTTYLKMAREMNLSQVLEALENAANEKSK